MGRPRHLGYDLLPGLEVGLSGPDIEQVDDLLVHALLVKVQGDLIDAVHVPGGEDRLHLDVAEEGDLGADVVGEGILGAAQEDIRLDADLPQGLHAVLRRLRLHFTGRPDEGDPGEVDEDGVLPSRLIAELADRLEKRLALDVAHRAPDFRDHHVDIRPAKLGDGGLDFVGNVRDHLHRLAEELATAFLSDHREIDLAGRVVAVAGKRAVGESFVVAEVEVRLAAVVEHEDLAVLVRAHGAGIDVEVGVDLLHADLQPAPLEEHPDRRAGKALAQRADHAPGDKNVLRHRYGRPAK